MYLTKYIKYLCFVITELASSIDQSLAEDENDEDPYFISESLDEEHLSFREAERRLQEKHQARVTVVGSVFNPRGEQNLFNEYLCLF